MLLQFAKSQASTIDYLIHDSTLFDGVDSRQRALALERAHRITTEMDSQYICALNSDTIPTTDFSKDFDFIRCVRHTLTDRDPSGSLLGFHFERKRA
jgi:uncharacterized protein YydD (DUF2326 family)